MVDIDHEEKSNFEKPSHVINIRFWTTTFFGMTANKIRFFFSHSSPMTGTIANIGF
jgi:hypothetical protein